jgi:muconolactone delta-isomerase
MYFLVFERRKGQDEPINDLGGMIAAMSEWLAYLKELMKKGMVAHHWAFRAQHGSVTVYDVASGDQLKTILEKCPIPERFVHREVHQVCDLDEAISNLAKYMTGI